MSQTRTLRFFRRIDGKKVPWELELDAESVAVRDEALTGVGKSPYLQDLDSRGIRYQPQPDGSLLITHMPDKEKQVVLFFTSSPCHFPGCEALRKEWLAAREAIRASPSYDPTCPHQCAEGKLMRQFRERILPLIPDVDSRPIPPSTTEDAAGPGTSAT